MMEQIRDKTFLRELSRAVCTELRSRHIGTLFRFKQKLELQSTNTNGWRVAIGSFAGYRCWAEIWLDQFPAHPERKVYYCLYSHEKKGFLKLTQLASREFGKHYSISIKDWDQNSDYRRLAKKLAKVRFGHPIYERYPESKDFFYGIYEYDRTGLQKNVFERLVERSVDFYETVAHALTDESPQTADDIYKTVENRRAVTRHLRRERKSHAATLCKQRDNYICQICNFDFSYFYGTLGNDFAEAHHVVPLSSNSKLRNTTIDDLITVCANCHRILHRMEGKEKDIDDLKKIVKARKKK